MSVTEQMSAFQELTDKLGSPYAAVNYISAKARQLRSTCPYDISESQALTWAITGVKPRPSKIIPHHEHISTTPIADMLEGVSSDIADAVIRTLTSTLHHKFNSNTFNTLVIPKYPEALIHSYLMDNNLDISEIQFNYREVDDDNLQSRVRILSRMIIDKYQSIGE